MLIFYEKDVELPKGQTRSILDSIMIRLQNLINPPKVEMRYYYPINTLTYQDNPCPDIKTQSKVMSPL